MADAETQNIREMVSKVRALAEQFGFCAFASRERTGEYLMRQFPKQPDNVAACLGVLYLPRYLECLQSLTADPQTRTQALQYWAFYQHLIERSGGDRARMESINRMFLLE